MTNSILNPQSKLSIQCNKQHNLLRGLVGLIHRSAKAMKKRHFQLQQIAKEHFDVIIRMDAEEHIKKQTKMLSISLELLSRVTTSLKHSKNHESVSKELVQQYFDEADILNFMDFEVTKKYFSFIHDHYQPRIIQMKPTMAA